MISVCHMWKFPTLVVLYVQLLHAVRVFISFDLFNTGACFPSQQFTKIMNLISFVLLQRVIVEEKKCLDVGCILPLEVLFKCC